MDQIKTGKFIACCRKEKGLTQREVAEKLGISDKTVSKWETGGGFPEVSLMLPLCEILQISVNELLSGERLSEDLYKIKAEENIMDLVKEKQESKKNIVLGVITVLITLLGGVTIVLLAGFIEAEWWLRVILIAIALIIIFGGIGVAVALEMRSGTFECKYCKTRFVPTTGAYIAGMHTITRRYLKCPNCGKRSFCKRRLTH